MFRNMLLGVVAGATLVAGMAASAVLAGPYDRDRDRDRDDYRDRDHHGYHMSALPDPGALAGFRGQNGRSFYFKVTGDRNAGSVWGSRLYTDDSVLAAAVVHAGVLEDGETGVVRVTILPDAGGYRGTDRNGVASGDWGGWQGCYRIDR